MNKTKLSLASASRALLNLCLVVALVLLASLVGVGGAALWIYNRPEIMTASASKHSSPRLKADVASNEQRALPKLTPVHADDETPSQLVPARYVPNESEIATFSGSPRYTYVSYNGGRQRAHLRVNTVAAEAAPAALSVEDSMLVQAANRPPLSDPGSRYITDAQGRVVGVDGTAEVSRVLSVQPAGIEPEVRVAAPVLTRKALPVDDDSFLPPTASTFDVRAELAREDDVPVVHAQHVTRSVGNIRPTMFGAGDDYRSFGRN